MRDDLLAIFERVSAVAVVALSPLQSQSHALATICLEGCACVCVSMCVCMSRGIAWAGGCPLPGTVSEHVPAGRNRCAHRIFAASFSQMTRPRTKVTSVSAQRQAREVLSGGSTDVASLQRPSPTLVRDVSAAPPGRDGGVIPRLSLVRLWRIFEKEAGRSATSACS